MEAPRATLVCYLGTLLTVVATLAFTFAGLEFLTMDNAVLTEVTTTSSLDTTRSLGFGDDGNAAYSLVSADDPNVRAATNFQRSLTLDVTIKADDQMQVSFANQTGFFAAYKHDAHVRDGFSASFDKMRTRALAFTSEAFG